MFLAYTTRFINNQTYVIVGFTLIVPPVLSCLSLFKRLKCI